MILLSTILFSCKEEPPVNSTQNLRILNSVSLYDFTNDVNTVGSLHNEYLDSMYTLLSKIKNDEIEQPDIPLLDYLIGNSLSFAYVNGFDNSNVDTTGISDFYFNPIAINDILTTDTILSQSAKNMLISLDSVFNVYSNDGITLMQFETYCNTNINIAYSLDSITEAYVVGIALSVAKNSANYWNTNFDDWIDLLEEESSIQIKNELKHQNKNNNRLLALSPEAKRVISADVAGAVGGAVHGLYYSWVGGPAVAIAITINAGLVGGAAASGVSALSIVIDVPWWLQGITG